MAKTSSKNTTVMIGAFNMSGFFNSLETSIEVDMLDTTTFGDDSKTFIAGMQNGTITLGGLFGGDVDEIDEEMNPTLGAVAASVVSTIVDGIGTQGNNANLMGARTSSYGKNGSADGVVSISVGFQGDGIQTGIVLKTLAQQTSSGNTATVDDGAGTTNGAVAHLHVTAADNGNVDVNVQDSPNDSAWSDLITFANVTTTPTAERGSVSGTVDRYVRAEWVGAATPDHTFAVTFARL